jgi:hypothetical protein
MEKCLKGNLAIRNSSNKKHMIRKLAQIWIFAIFSFRPYNLNIFHLSHCSYINLLLSSKMGARFVLCCVIWQYLVKKKLAKFRRNFVFTLLWIIFNSIMVAIEMFLTQLYCIGHIYIFSSRLYCTDVVIKVGSNTLFIKNALTTLSF